MVLFKQFNSFHWEHMSPRYLALVADPDSQSARALQVLLEALGLETVRAHDGNEALRLIGLAEPRLVVAQIALEPIDGYALSSRLRQKEPTRTIPIVLVGHEDARAGRLAALRAGADDFLSLPLDEEEAKLHFRALLRRLSLGSQNGSGPRNQKGAPRAHEVHENELEEPLRPARPASRQLYRSTVEEIREICTRVEKGELPNLRGLEETASQIVRATRDSTDPLQRALGPREALDWAAHQVNVAILALTLARELELNKDELRLLALAALVHDLGMLKVPSSILEAPRSLRVSERERVKEHPRHTYEILRAGGLGEEVARLALQEHERESGQGYPHGLRGAEIGELAKILGVADVFEACTHPRPYAKTFIPYEAVQVLLEMRDVFFHSRYIKALMNALTVYPIGSYVLLNTGEIARVSATNRKNLMRPEVEVLWDKKGRTLSEVKRLDLSQLPFLFINKPLSPDALPELHKLEEASPSS